MHHDTAAVSGEHCDACARDAKRDQILNIAASVIATEDSKVEGLQEARALAVRVVMKAFHDYLLPAGLG